MKFFALAIALMFTTSAFAANYKCVGKKETRSYIVTYGDAVNKLPCELQVKRTDGTTVVLYSAKNTVGYCDKQQCQMVKEAKKAGMTCTIIP